jgi:phage shock protein C
MFDEKNGHRRLYKSRRLRMIDGICGGISEYFGVDVTIIRILFVLLVLMGGTGLLLYIAAMIIMPTNPDFTAMPEPQGHRGGDKRFWGVFLILVGATVLFINLGWLAGFDWWSLSGSVVLPVLMIAAGMFVIFGVRSKGAGAAAPVSGAGPAGETGTGDAAGMAAAPAMPAIKELRRSIRNRKLFGVCGGLGEYFGIDPTIVRLIAVALVFASFGWMLLVYLALGILMPEEKLSMQS